MRSLTYPWEHLRARQAFENIKIRGSYMSAHILLNLLNELRKKDKMPDFAEVFPQRV